MYNYNRTYRGGCQAFVKIQKDGVKLRVVSANMQHKHIVDPSLSASYPTLDGIAPEKLDNLKAYVESGTSRGQLRNFLKINVLLLNK